MSNTHKTLSPERLPQPSGDETQGSPRQRVVEHAQRLLSDPRVLGTVAGAMALSSCGFSVVDPLPEPFRCENVTPDPGVYAIEIHASYGQTPQPDRRFLVEMTLTFRGLPEGLFYTSTDVVGGTLVSPDSLGPAGVLNLEISPDLGASELLVTVHMDCRGLDSSSTWRVDLMDPPQAGATLTVVPQ